MVEINVTPETFTMVEFSSSTIADVARNVVEKLQLDDFESLNIDIDETSPLARASISSLDPLTMSVEGGAFEDTRRPRQLSEDRTADTIGRHLLKATDRMGDAFADAPSDDELTLAQAVAWDVYSVGRLARSGFKGQRKRRLYQFRNRHGFTDAADEAFAELWTTDGLSWADVDRLSTSALEVAGLA